MDCYGHKKAEVEVLYIYGFALHKGEEFVKDFLLVPELKCKN